MPELGDEADAPIIVPPPGQILRRAARTKIRKPGLPGDGAGHRFGSSRRIRRSSTEGRRTSGELSSSENGEYETLSPPRRQTMSDDGFVHHRPDSFSEEASIFDAYVRDDEEDPFATPGAATPTHEHAPSTTPRLADQPSLGTPEIQPSLLEALAPVLTQSEPLTLSDPSEGLSLPSPRTPSPTIEPPVRQSPPPSVAPFPPQPQQAQQQPPSAQPSISSQGPHILAPIPQQHNRKDKDKKGLFGKWGGDKGGKKAKAAAAAEKEKEKEREKEGFFGSLFGGKKKQDDAVPVTNSAGREAAHALLGASKSSKNYTPPPTSPGLVAGSPNFARYPIHVERAIYRLSHIKLANPRRPLYEQVLISNLMFWYLGVINKAQAATNSSDSQSQAEKEAQEKEQKEKEAKEKAEKEKQEKEQRERELEAKKRESGRRGSLTKTPAGGAPPGRRAEMPIKGPQYEMQQQVMQKEYNGFNGQAPPGRPPQGGPNGQPYQGPPRGPGSPQPQQFPQHQQQYQQPPPQAQIYPPQGQPYQQPYPPAQGQQYPNPGPPPRGGPPQGRPQGPDHYYYQSNENGPPRGGLPPGAMAPGMGGPGGPPPHMQQPMNPNQPPRQGPPPNFQPPAQGRPPYPMANGPENGPPPSSSGRGPSRSVSANAVPASHPPPMNGTLRKGNSAHAAAPYDPNRRPRTAEGKGRPSEEEDMPLAVYQQQHRK